MTALLLSFLSNPTMLAIMGGLLAVLVAFFKGNSRGARLERAKQAEAERKARTIADEIDDAVAGRSPDANREELRKWSKR